MSTIESQGNGQHYAEWDAHKKGKATVRGLIREDIDAVLTQSFTYATFLAALRKSGYEIKAGANVKHTAVKPPGSSRFIRLDSLGAGYTEEAIKRRLSQVRSAPVPDPVAPTVSAPRRKCFSRQKRNRRWQRKPKGLRDLYVYYLYLLGAQRTGTKQRVPLALRKEVIRLHRYQEQYQLLREYRIDTDDQLTMLAGAFQANIDALVDNRKVLYRQQRKGENVAEEIAAINESLRLLRKKHRLCANIQADIPVIREQMQTVQQQEQKEIKQHKQERRPAHWM